MEEIPLEHIVGTSGHRREGRNGLKGKEPCGANFFFVVTKPAPEGLNPGTDAGVESL
jgi:hypothetical protein